MNNKKNYLNVLEYLKIVFITICSYFIIFNLELYYLYPIIFLLMINVFIRLFSLGHDGIHGLISTNKKINDFFSRYFFHAPIMFSFNRYRVLHLLHHKYLGSNLDPDQPIDNETPKNYRNYFFTTLKRVFIGHHIYTAVLFYTDITRIFSNNQSQIRNYKKDSLNLVLFWLCILSISYYYGLLTAVVVIWLIPLSFFSLVVELFSLLQHRNIDSADPAYTREIFPTGFIHFFFPAGVSYHKIHHDDVTIPWYNLKKCLEDSNRVEKTKMSKVFDELFGEK